MFPISLEEMGQFDGCLIGIMAIALRWGVIDIPDDQQVCIHGIRLENDQVIERGMNILLPREKDAPPWVMTADIVEECTVVFVAETLIDIIEALLEAKYKKSIPTWGDGC